MPLLLMNLCLSSAQSRHDRSIMLLFLTRKARESLQFKGGSNPQKDADQPSVVRMQRRVRCPKRKIILFILFPSSILRLSLISTLSLPFVEPSNSLIRWIGLNFFTWTVTYGLKKFTIFLWRGFENHQSMLFKTRVTPIDPTQFPRLPIVFTIHHCQGQVLICG